MDKVGAQNLEFDGKQLKISSAEKIRDRLFDISFQKL